MSGKGKVRSRNNDSFQILFPASALSPHQIFHEFHTFTSNNFSTIFWGLIGYSSCAREVDLSQVATEKRSLSVISVALLLLIIFNFPYRLY
jgi:hypothetical protein